MMFYWETTSRDVTDEDASPISARRGVAGANGVSMAVRFAVDELAEDEALDVTIIPVQVARETGE